MQARADFVRHLEKLINRPDLSDLEFVCKDGVKVQACRIFFAGRSPVLDSMLKSGMLESNSSVINLPEISGPVLLAILEFLYTSSIAEYRPKDWKMGLEIIAVAHFLLLPTVDKIVEEFLMEQIPGVGEDLQQAATMLSIALTFKNLSHDDITAFLQLAKFLEPVWMHPNYACHLSEEAVAFILRHTKPISRCEVFLSATLEEYFRFRGILLWCMYSSRDISAFDEIADLVNTAIPTAKGKLYGKGIKDLSSLDVVWLPEYDEGRAQDEILQFLRQYGALESAIRLLAHIDWVRIPATFLVKIVEPMEPVPGSCLAYVFRCHALHRVMMMPLKVTWDHNESYSVHNDGLLVRKNGRSSGSALCKLENRDGDDLCAWRFTVQNITGSFCQLGFVCREGPHDDRLSWLLDHDCVDALSYSRTTISRVIQWQPKAGKVYFIGHGGDLESRNSFAVDTVEKIEFQYSRSTRSCAVTVDKREFGTIWDNLPGSSIYPAVSIGHNSGAWVSLCGFEVL